MPSMTGTKGSGFLAGYTYDEIAKRLEELGINFKYHELNVPTSGTSGDAWKLKDQIKFLKEGLDITISMYEGEIIGVTLPEKVEYEVTETSEAVKGNTTNNAMKDATIETGYTLKAPLFISEGEEIVITTRDGKYFSRG